MFSVTNWLLPNEVAVPPAPANRRPRSSPDLAGQSDVSPWILTVGRCRSLKRQNPPALVRTTSSLRSRIRMIKASAISIRNALEYISRTDGERKGEELSVEVRNDENETTLNRTLQIAAYSHGRYYIDRPLSSLECATWTLSNVTGLCNLFRIKTNVLSVISSPE